jgi:hypothetical protein
VLIGGLHVGQMTGLERSDVVGHQFLVDDRIGAGWKQGDHCKRSSERTRDSGCEPAGKAARRSRWGKFRKRVNPSSEVVGQRMTDAISPKQPAHRLQSLQFLAAVFAPRDVGLDERGIRGIELAIDEAAEQQFLISAGGHLLHAP